MTASELRRVVVSGKYLLVAKRYGIFDLADDGITSRVGERLGWREPCHRLFFQIAEHIVSGWWKPPADTTAGESRVNRAT